jgi:hypothetical protein
MRPFQGLSCIHFTSSPDIPLSLFYFHHPPTAIGRFPAYCLSPWLATPALDTYINLDPSVARLTHPWWWRQYTPLKRRSTIILHGSTTQKTALNIVQKNVGTFGINPCDEGNCLIWRHDTGFILLHSFIFYFTHKRIPHKNNTFTAVNLNNVNGKIWLETSPLSILYPFSMFITTFHMRGRLQLCKKKNISLVIPSIYWDVALIKVLGKVSAVFIHMQFGHPSCCLEDYSLLHTFVCTYLNIMGDCSIQKSVQFIVSIKTVTVFCMVCKSTAQADTVYISILNYSRTAQVS